MIIITNLIITIIANQIITTIRIVVDLIIIHIIIVDFGKIIIIPGNILKVIIQEVIANIIIRDSSVDTIATQRLKTRISIEILTKQGGKLPKIQSL